MDEPDLSRWIAAFRGPLIGLLASWRGNWRDAEELAADVFAEAWLSRARFDGDAADIERAGAWLRGIAFRVQAAAARREERRAAASLDGVEVAQPEAEVDERRELLDAAFAKLAAPQQSILRMFYLEETSAREVAALLDITTKAAEERLRAARNELRELVQREARQRERGHSAQGARA
ncbi:MAG: sigma-70 family RNA polymerase sigma factor [Planctomycetota bacterium]|nr:MAG: sigma-70 family RNA polymerase sigma factor [Planctomycetota bacterium]